VKRQSQERLEYFDSFLEWLDSDRDRAAEKYEMIRQSLIQIFIWKGCLDAESLADETFDRVMLRVPELKETYVGNPSHYIHGVAKKLLAEQTQVRTVPLETLVLPNPRTRDIENEKMSVCLERCLSNLSPYSRDLILNYYSEEHAEKIFHRKELGEKLGMSVNQLRVRMFRIRNTLEACIGACMGHEGSV
jgi:DNA-directed RNA polymerase specialized sigma24 family protein